MEGFAYESYPVAFWDVSPRKGTRSNDRFRDGPLLLSRILNLNETQAGVPQHRLQDRRRQRAVAPRSQGPPVDGAVRGGQRGPVQGQVRKHLQGQCRAIQRNLLVIEEQGGEKFFGEPPSTSTISCRPTQRQGDHQHPRGRQADAVAQGLRPLSCSGFSRSSSSSSRGRRSAEAETRLLLSTRRTFSSKTSRRPLRTKSSRSCGSSDPRGRRVLHHAKPPRYSRRRTGSAGKPRPACPAAFTPRDRRP